MDQINVKSCLFRTSCQKLFQNFQKLPYAQFGALHLPLSVEAYLEYSRTSTRKLFCENNSRLLADNYFRKKTSRERERNISILTILHLSF